MVSLGLEPRAWDPGISAHQSHFSSPQALSLAQSEQSLERVLDRTREERAPCTAPKDRPGVPERKVHSCTVQEAAGLGGKAEMGA